MSSAPSGVGERGLRPRRFLSLGALAAPSPAASSAVRLFLGFVVFFGAAAAVGAVAAAGAAGAVGGTVSVWV